MAVIHGSVYMDKPGCVLRDCVVRGEIHVTAANCTIDNVFVELPEKVRAVAIQLVGGNPVLPHMFYLTEEQSRAVFAAVPEARAFMERSNASRP